MKKLIALLLALVMVMSLCACSVSGGGDVEITLWPIPSVAGAPRLPLIL